ncbi:carboxymuconolactone decarboxylase family protein [Pedobacter sp. BMA]|uniref:carboxymuconolactone decarboxylase family protein n=1 Tax=Pedobacter sp. BMA TaxID=1663685 RepID=UPI00069F58D7|nr:carboxymuconolactone decarboxylase family protein [Pedobacter sp. BMA]
MKRTDYFNMRYLKGIIAILLLLIGNVVRAQDKQTEALNSHQVSLGSIAALTAVGDLKQLKTEINTGLDAGLTINEIKEALVQLYAYCGFPRSLNAINTYMEVLSERKKKGIVDKPGKDDNPETDKSGRYEQGRKVLEQLSSSPQVKPAPGFGEFAPRIDAFLKEHLFADIFASSVLNHRQREFVTISALSAMPGVESQLQSHIKMGRNTGITDAQLISLSNVIEKCINRTQANTLRKLISASLAQLPEPGMMVRISEIEIFPNYLTEYNAILKEEAAASVNVEPGVVCIFPMYIKEDPNQIRIIEIYANKEAYQSHLKTPHFQHYKTTTLPMVKSLKLIDMSSLDPGTMTKLFEKLN